MGDLKKRTSSSVRISTPKKKKIFLDALEKSHGVIQPALDTAQIVRGTYLNWLKSDEKFAQGVADAAESGVDFIEGKLFQNIENNKEISIIFALKTRGAHRGWVEKTQMDITSGGDKIEFSFGNVTNVNNPDLKITDVNEED